MDYFRTIFSCLPYATGQNSPVQSRNTPVAMTTPHTTSLHTENKFCICTYSFTLMKLMRVIRPVETKSQGINDVSSSKIFKYRRKNCNRMDNKLKKLREKLKINTMGDKLINKRIKQYDHKLGHVIAQAVSRWLPTAVARVRIRAACGVSGGQSSTGAGFLQVFRFPLPIIIPPISPSS
jgi:hypothetical protein